MAYLLWPLIGVIVAMVFGIGPGRRAYLPKANSSLLAGAFGALIGGVIGDGVRHVAGGTVTITGVVGAVVGSLLFCWAIRDRAEDREP